LRKFAHPVILAALFLLAFLPLRAQDGRSVGNDDYSFTLPPRWTLVDNPKAQFMGVPPIKDGRLFATMTEAGEWTCPVPREESEWSGYEKGYWRKFDSGYATHSRSRITATSIAEMNGIPFRVIDSVRDPAPGSQAPIYMEAYTTPGNGNSYAIVMAKTGLPPGEDAELSAALRSFAFRQPPRISLLQRALTQQFSNILSLPLNFALAGMAIYFLTVRKREDVPRSRKFNVCVWGLVLAVANAQWIAGFDTAGGLVSTAFMIFFGLLLLPLQRKQQALAAEGKIPRPAPDVLKRRFWIFAVSGMAGLAFANVSFVMEGLPLWLIVTSDVGTACIFGLVLWSVRRKFFPEPPAQTTP
jgi:hypothetical protein